MGGYGTLIEQPTNLNATSPAAPAGGVNVQFQADAPTPPPTTVVRKISAYVPAPTTSSPGCVPALPNDSTKCLDGTGNWSAKGSGGGGTPSISQYLSPATITPPSGLSWAYHSNAAYGFNANGAMVLTTHGSSSGEVLGETISSGDFDLIACLVGNCPLTGSGQIAFGVSLWDSGSGKVITYFLNLNAGATSALYVQHGASFTASFSTAFTTNVEIAPNSPIWFRINYSYGKYTYYLSVDGQSWDRCYQESATAYLPVEATNAGLVCFNSVSTPANVVVPHFVVTSYVGS
jgi:hypothetical protein